MKSEQIALVFLLAAFLLFVSCEKNLKTNLIFHDDNFLKALIEQEIDTDGDGNINSAEAESIRSIDVSNDSISDMTGIGAFINLDTLLCYGNQLSSLDVSKNTKLIYLACFDNQLSTLEFSDHVALLHLNVYRNSLSELDISGLSALKWLDCDNNQLTELDLSKNTFLEGLSCDHNQLTFLDLSNQLELHHLECGSNKFTSLDISNNSKLGTVYIGYLCLVLDHMPSLREVCVWTMPFPPEGLNLSTEGSPNVYFTKDCMDEH